MNRLFRAVARTRATSAVVTLVMFCLAAAAVAAAAANPPLYWPSLDFMLPHLPNVNNLLHVLPHLRVPHFGVGPSRLGLTRPAHWLGLVTWVSAGSLASGTKPARRLVGLRAGPGRARPPRWQAGCGGSARRRSGTSGKAAADAA